ncbi:hypothetical protein CEXT_460671 [Caerostris extrusa]|uniref:Uncharacterized protein n=1 Tax=Caerostris extrusa TaxID=172846 RepID=A0AAV4SX37_CAEEX|nr:hypothetical protein CEXT_460671 [Caerostris extrusa]
MEELKVKNLSIGDLKGNFPFDNYPRADMPVESYLPDVPQANVAQPEEMETTSAPPKRSVTTSAPPKKV